MYGDTILKGFATSVVVVLATVLSIFIWSAKADGWFVVGAAMVMTAVALYSKYPPTEDKHDASQKSIGLPRMRLLSMLAIVLFTVGNLVYSSATDYEKNMEFMEHPVEKFSESDGFAEGPTSPPPTSPPTIPPTSSPTTSKVTCPDPAKSAWGPGNPKTKLDRIQLDRILVAEQVAHYVLSILQERDVPVALIQGTSLHAFRNAGSGSCFQANRMDDDIDMVVSRHHLISEFDGKMHLDLMNSFGWGIRRSRDGNIIQIVPGDEVAEPVAKTPFQIDISTFECDVVKGLVHIPWGNVYIDLKAFFPFERRDWILPGSMFNGTTFFGLAFDLECLLENQYGPDFRTPKSEKFFRGNMSGSMLVGQPPCKVRPMNEDQQRQFKKQILVCEGCDASKANKQVLDDLAKRSPVNSTVCFKQVP